MIQSIYHLDLKVWIAVVAAVLILAWISATAVRGAKSRAILIVLRLLIWSLSLVLLLRPLYVKQALLRERQTLSVLIDRSQSMTLPSQDGTRHAQVQKLLAHKEFWEGLKANYDLAFFELGKTVTPTTYESLLNAAVPEDKESRIDAALLSTLEQGHPILLISDGSDTDSTLPPERSNIDSLPIVALYPSNPRDLKDYAVLQVRHSEVAYLKNRIQIDAEVEAIGVSKKDVRVRLLSGNRILSQLILAEENWTDHKATVTFSFVPDRLGPMGLTVEIPPVLDEITQDNNRKSTVLRVMADRTRVLHVAGKPTWDERFLRSYLKQNPNLDLVSFFILRAPHDNPQASQDELSLIPFPYQDLFTKELENFDLVIFQNFDFKTYFSSYYLSNLKQFVENGGGFVMLGGDQSFGVGNYKGTPIEEILPIKIRQASSEISMTPFRPVLTSEGKLHPITYELKNNLQNLPTFLGLHRAGSLQPGGLTLLSHPTETVQGKPLPVIAARAFGKGRVVSIQVDSLWRWAFNEKTGERPYDSLWNGIYRWLIQDPSSSYIRMERVGPDLQTTIFQKDYTPWNGVRPQVEISQGGNILLKSFLKPTDSNGQTSMKLPVVKGLIEVRAYVPSKEHQGFEAKEIFAMEEETREYERRGVDLSRLQIWTERTGGELFPIGKIPSSFPSFDRAAIFRPAGEETISIWDHPLILFFLLFFVCLEWGYRRRRGAS